MVPLQQQVDTEEGENQDTKADNGHYGRSSTPPAHGQSFMQQDGIKYPGDGRPDFFRVPAPESSPVGFGKYQAGNHAQGKQGESHHDAGISAGV